MRKVKFRGKDMSGVMRYGDLLQYRHEVAIKHWQGSISPEYEVDPESVGQLVGYDADGKEVYEGDLVTADDGREYKAIMLGGVITTAGGKVDFVTINRCELKK